MKHDELLAKFDDLFAFDDKGHALRAVVELHKPRNVTDRNIQGDVVTEQYCQVCEYLQGMNYPCSTIQVIEKELL
jgi:hypothetical protein